MNRRTGTLFLIIAFLGASVDLVTKWVSFHFVDLGHVYPVIGDFFEVAPTLNAGAAFGMLKGQRAFFIVVSFLALGGVTLYAVFRRNASTLFAAALGLITSGIIGNLFDRIFIHGRVRDFLYLHWKDGFQWPTFNAADVFICVGITLALASVMRRSRTAHTVRESRTELPGETDTLKGENDSNEYLQEAERARPYDQNRETGT